MLTITDEILEIWREKQRLEEECLRIWKEIVEEMAECHDNNKSFDNKTKIDEYMAAEKKLENFKRKHSEALLLPKTRN